MNAPPLSLHAAAAAAARHLDDCLLCPHGCGTARRNATGVCRVGKTSYIASEMMHMGEEKLLQPAHAIFFSGCTATCTFCAAARFAFRPTYGVAVTPAQLAARIRQRRHEGARAVCFIGGDPTPHIPFILATLVQLDEPRGLPTVLNSNFYVTSHALTLLAPAIDLYLPDLKFGPESGPDGCGERLGGMPDYWPVVTGNIRRVRAAGKRTIVRHLLMPGHLECCTRPVLAWLADQPEIEVSLLTQYLAPTQGKDAQGRRIARGEIEAARALAQAHGLRLVE